MTAPVARRWIPFALWLAAALLFFIANRPAYKGYFSDDDLANVSWPPVVGGDVFYKGLLTPKISESNFRPVGYLYYRVMGRAFHLRYPPYVAVLQAFHVLNVILLFLLLGRLGFRSLPPAQARSFTLSTRPSWRHIGSPCIFSTSSVRRYACWHCCFTFVDAGYLR